MKSIDLTHAKLDSSSSEPRCAKGVRGIQDQLMDDTAEDGFWSNPYFPITATTVAPRQADGVKLPLLHGSIL